MSQPALKTETVWNGGWRATPQAHAVVISRKRWKPYLYLEQIGDEVVNALANGGGVIIVNLPPRHGKSEFISYHLPTWFLDNYPTKRVILTTYGADLSALYGRRVRNEIRDNPAITAKVAEDSQAADQWSTTAGGGMTSVGIGGGITGKGGDLILVDDPVKDWEEADSEAIQKRNIEWFKTTLWTRREPGAVVVLLMTRWHKKDLCGYLLSKELQEELSTAGGTRFVHLKFPGVANKDDPLGRQPGQALCPERYDEQALKEIRVLEGSRHWSGLYQQEPVDAEDAVIKQHWIQYTDKKPQPARAYITTDQAYSMKKTADYSVITLSLIDDKSNLYVWEVLRGRVSVQNFINALFNLVDRTLGLESVSFEIPAGETEENSSLGLLLKNEMERRGTWFTLKPIRSGKDKLSRATKLIALLSNGKVFLRKGLTDVEDELINFPTGDHDDIVDTLSMATLVMAAAQGKPHTPQVPKSWMSA